MGIKKQITAWWQGLTPFRRARLGLTGWYMMIFSIILVFFTYLTFQAKESAFVRVYTVVNQYDQGGQQAVELNNRFDEFNARFKRRVIWFDLGLWWTALYLSYGLSGKTLKPIKDMWQEQKLFVADVSHGLRTPISTIQLQLEAFRRTRVRSGSAVKELIGNLLEETAYLSRIIDGVLSLTRLESPRQMAETKLVNLAAVGREVILGMKPLFTAKQQVIKVMGRKKLMVRGNQDQLKQLWLILLDNANKYAGRRASIRIGLEQRQASAWMQVVDNGPGIKEYEQGKLFERFFRGSSGRAKTQGAGLGLAMAKKIVTSHQGELGVKSQPNKRTVFWVKLPLAFLGSS